jgi:hypothetical protein
MDRGGDYYDLSYGYMDCTPHFISLPKRLVLEESLMDI